MALGQSIAMNVSRSVRDTATFVENSGRSRGFTNGPRALASAGAKGSSLFPRSSPWAALPGGGYHFDFW
jgi:hypothetical protein